MRISLKTKCIYLHKAGLRVEIYKIIENGENNGKELHNYYINHKKYKRKDIIPEIKKILKEKFGIVYTDNTISNLLAIYSYLYGYDSEEIIGNIENQEEKKKYKKFNLEKYYKTRENEKKELLLKKIRINKKSKLFKLIEGNVYKVKDISDKRFRELQYIRSDNNTLYFKSERGLMYTYPKHNKLTKIKCV